MIGTSIYLSSFSIDELEKYAKYGIKSIFTSLHIPEERIDLQQVKKLIDTAQIYEMDLIVDVSPQTLAILEISEISELLKYGIKSVRLDYGFEDLKFVKEISEYFTIILNASVVTPEYVQSLTDNGIEKNKIKALHNFYPKVNSGLDKDTFLHKNSELHKIGIEVYAFVAGDLEYRLPTFDGLVTLEHQRGLNSYCAALEMFIDCNVDGVFIGDGRISEESLKKIVEYDKNNNVVELRVSLTAEYDYMYNHKYERRKDSNNRVIRLLTRSSSPVPQANCFIRKRGAITITNNNYGRYKNEIELCNVDLGFDNRFNTIGYVYQEDYELLGRLSNATSIIFRRI